jgi:hypothetical protein
MSNIALASHASSPSQRGRRAAGSAIPCTGFSLAGLVSGPDDHCWCGRFARIGIESSEAPPGSSRVRPLSLRAFHVNASYSLFEEAHGPFC